MREAIVMSRWEVENIDPEREISVIAEYVQKNGKWDDVHITTKRKALGMARLALSFRQQLEDEELRANRVREEKASAAATHARNISGMRADIDALHEQLAAVNADRANLEMQLDKVKSELASKKKALDIALRDNIYLQAQVATSTDLLDDLVEEIGSSEYTIASTFDRATYLVREHHAESALSALTDDDPYGDISLSRGLGFTATSIPMIKLERLIQQSKLGLSTEDLKEMAYLATLAYSYAIVEDDCMGTGKEDAS